MHAPNWEDHDAETNTIVNYFAGRQHTELILRKIFKKIELNCFYCKNCKHCKKLSAYKEVFKRQGFCSFNKDIKYWNVYKPDGCKRNRIFKLSPIKNPKFKVKLLFLGK